MKIAYKVLWIEDNFDEVKPFVKGLEIKLKKYGFKFDVVSITALNSGNLNELNRKLSNYNPYDMIIFDYDLGDSMKGDEIASQLRSNIYTDMIFYSGKPGVELRKALYDQKVDGVYIVHRTNFVDEAWPIIEDQIKRICDINNMRGILLDEMSKIDVYIRNLYKNKYDSLLDEDKEQQLSRFKRKYKMRKDEIEGTISNVCIKSFATMITNPVEIEFNIIRSRLNSIYSNDELFGESGVLKSKQDLRNKFAHNKAVYDDENGTVSLDSFDQTYNFNDFTNIRNDLINLLQDLENIEEK